MDPNMYRTLLACAVLFLGAAVRCRGDAYAVDRRGRVARLEGGAGDAGKSAADSALPSVEMGRKRL